MTLFEPGGETSTRDSLIRRWGRGGRDTILVVLALFVVIPLLVAGGVYLFGDDERSTESIAAEIEASVRENTPPARRDIRVSVDCPDPVEWRVGETFRCVVAQGRQSILVTVTMENDDGYVTWQAG